MSQDVLIAPDTRASRYPLPVLLPSVLADVVAVLVFVAIGRATHDETAGAIGLFGTAWPFLVGVAGGWLGIFLARLAPLSLLAAGMMVVKTVILGLVLRAVVQGEGTPLSFALTTLVVLTVLFTGWRVAAQLATRRGLSLR